jgi:hypothetical protein
LPTLQQLISRTLPEHSTETRSIPTKRHHSATPKKSIKNKRKRLLRPNRMPSDTEESNSDDDDDDVDPVDSSISEEDMDEDGNDEFVYATEGKVERIISSSKFLI